MLRKAALNLALLITPLALQAVFVGPPSSSAGVVDKTIEKEYEVEEVPPEKEIPLLENEVENTQPLKLPWGRKVYIENVEFIGNTVFSSKELHHLIEEDLGAKLSIEDIQQICQKIQAFYAQNGYFLCRVFPPEQLIEKNVLKIQILEGRLGSVSVVGNRYYSTSFIEKYFAHLQGEPVHYRQMMRALFLLNENTDLAAGAIFKKGKKTGTADLVIRADDKLPFHLYVDTNNYGSHQTTQQRSGARLEVGNLFLDGDKLTFIEVVGSPMDDLQFSDLIYKAHLNSRGTDLELNYLYSNFDINDLNALHLHGRSQIAGVKVNHALLRTQHLNTDLYISMEIKEIKNFSQGALTSLDKLRDLHVGGKVDYIDTWKGRTLGEFYATQGIPNFLGGLKAVDSRASREGSGALFTILNLDATRIQTIWKDSFVLLHGSGQWTHYKLPLAEQFYIGGMDTVRGYPLAVGLGDMGYYANLEFRIPPFFLPNKKVGWLKKSYRDLFQFVFFLDNGGVFLNGTSTFQETPSEIVTQPSPIYLTSAGAGLRFFGPYDVNVSFDVGFPLTEEKKSSNSIVYLKISWQLW